MGKLNKSVWLDFTAEEIEIIDTQAKTLQLSRANFIRSCCITKVKELNRADIEVFLKPTTSKAFLLQLNSKEEDKNK